MAVDELANVRHNMMRRHILTIAAKAYPRSVDSELLRATMATLGYPMDSHTLDFYLNYLAEKSCLTLDRKEGFGITLVRITAYGIDAMDGRVKDCGIEC
jgi:hypothetical protein